MFGYLFFDGFTSTFQEKLFKVSFPFPFPLVSFFIFLIPHFLLHLFYCYYIVIFHLLGIHYF